MKNFSASILEKILLATYYDLYEGILAVSLLKCNAGFHFQLLQTDSLAISTGSCEPCPLGQYKPEYGISICQLCPYGTYSNSLNSTSCKLCKESEYCPSGKLNSN